MMQKWTVAALIVLAVAASPARAELGGADSLELMVAQATTVVYGTIEPGGALRVLRAVKGESRPSIAIDTSSGALRDARPRQHVLVFLDADGKPTSSLYQTGVLRFQDAQSKPVYTMDWQVLTDESVIVLAALDAAKWPRAEKAISIEVPLPLAASGGVPNYLRFPVDRRLESAARRWIDQYGAEQAMQALSEFPSPENAAILRRLLQYRDDNSTYSAGRLCRVVYPVPDLAWHALQAWGEHVPRPIMVAPDDYYRQPRWYAVVCAILLLTLPAVFVMAIAKRARVRKSIAMLLATLTVLMLVLVLRSHRVVDEFYRDQAKRQVWISSTGGWLQVTYIPNWRGRVAADRYVPLGEAIDGIGAGGIESSYPHLKPPRGWLYGALPFQGLTSLWTVPPTRVTRDDDWHIARVMSGFDLTTYGPDKPPLAVQRFQVRWVVLIAACGTWPAAWSGIGVYRKLRRRRRRKRGCCVGCGYDLRGSSTCDRCPECGLAFSS